MVFVAGRPIQQGSKIALPGGRGRTNLVESADKLLKPWRKQIVRACRDDLGQPRVVFDRDVPIAVLLVFAMPRTTAMPTTHRGRARHHTVKPDLDKLERAVNDALTLSGVIGDDAQITSVDKRKRYARIGEDPGLYLTLYPDPAEGT